MKVEDIIQKAEAALKQGKELEAKKFYLRYLDCFIAENRNLVYLNLANICINTKDISLAINYLKLSLESIPLWQARIKLGDIYTNSTAQYQLALEQLDTLIAENTHPHPQVPYALAGNIWMILNKPEKALPYFAKAVELAPKNSLLLDRLAFIYFTQGDFTSAEKMQKKALNLDYSASLLFNLAEIYRKQKRLDECLDTFGKAIELEPDFVDLRGNHAHALLHAGRYDIAWKESEWRRKKKGLFRPFPQPYWDGYEIAGIENETLLLYGEQGFGDTVQFIRFIPLLREKFPWKKVMLEVNPPLIPLLKDYVGSGVDEIYGYNDAPLTFSHHVSVMTLPLILNIDSFSKIPPCPYLRVNGSWPTITRTTFNVGICWHGRDPGMDKRLEEIGARRNIPLRLWKPILDVENVSFYSLQKGDANSEIAHVENHIIDYTHKLTDWNETAKLILQLDLIICVDTAICHLAGALNVPTWVLSRSDECWRWLLEKDVGSKSPWYESIRLFRQKDWVSWDSTIVDVAKELRLHIANWS